jgi:hypothetical protein
MNPDGRVGDEHVCARWSAEAPIRYALVLEAEGCQFLIDPRALWKPPRVVVRRGHAEAEIWLDEDDVSFMRSSLDAHAERLVLALVSEKLEELLMWWYTLKDDVRRGRLERNVLVD